MPETDFTKEPFKLSTKSICHGCTKISEKCAMKWKLCESDSKIGKAFIVQCNEFTAKQKEQK